MIPGTGLMRTLRPVDALTIAFTAMLSLIVLAYLRSVDAWVYLLPINILGSLGLVAIAWNDRSPGKSIVRFVHDWYPVAIIFLVFKEVYVISHAIGASDWDPLLIAIDRMIFHNDPTLWITRFASPPITELLQIAYVSYYCIMLTLGIESFIRGDKRQFSFVMFTVTYGFFLSYLGYLMFPAVGPRFTLHSFDALGHDLPGLYVTDALREFINSGESIPRDVVNPIAFAQRDAFPSGHTQMTLIVMYLAHHYRFRTRWALTIAGTLLIISTVYLRYHYVVDLLGGAIFMIFTVWSAPKIFRRWGSRNPS